MAQGISNVDSSFIFKNYSGCSFKTHYILRKIYVDYILVKMDGNRTPKIRNYCAEKDLNGYEIVNN